MEFLKLFVAILCVTKLFAVELIPFNETNGDFLALRGDDLLFGPIEISSRFKFYGNEYTEIYINSNGILSFDSQIDSINISAFKHLNLTMLAPFWSDIDTDVCGDIYFRVIDDNVLLDSLGNDIRSLYSNLDTFQIRWAFVVTWYQVCAYLGIRTLTNTFQVILITDGEYSFAILNYETLMWPNSSTNAVSAVAGFTGADGSQNYLLPGSYTSEILMLTQKSNTNMPGKWVYRIDSAVIHKPKYECSENIEIIPSVVFFIGTDHVLVRNLCLEFTDEVKIFFNNAVESRCFILNATSCYFQVPFLNKIGKITISVRINGENAFDGFMFSKDVPLREEIRGLKYLYPLDKLGSTLVKWDPSYDHGYTISDISSYGIAFIFVDDSNVLYSYSFILQENANYAGTVIDLNHILQAAASIELRKRSLTNEIKFSFIGIYKETRLSSEELLKSWVTISPIFLNSISFEEASEDCKEWNRTEPKNYFDTQRLSACWPMLELDPITGEFPLGFGNFIQHWSCNPYRTELCALLHPGAVVCYKTIATGDYSYYGQTCCYSKDNRLIFGQPGGGSLTTVHPNFPLDHFYKDVRPFFKCCIISDNCDLYYLNRPSDNGEYWKSHSVAAVTGDPHFYRFDSVPFTLNAYGEYILLTVQESYFQIQVRLLPYTQSRNTGSVVKAIVIRNSFKSHMQIEIQSDKVSLFIDEVEFYLENGESIQSDDLYIRFINKAYLIHYDNQISLQVKINEKSNALSIIIMMPDDLEHSGLLKAMQMPNTFMLPNDTVFNINVTNDREIFYRYSGYWKVNRNITVFNYRDGITGYESKSFLPSFMINGIKFTNTTIEQNAIKVCGENKRCLFDISVTNDPLIGLMTLETETELDKLNAFIKTASRSCIALGSSINNGKITTILAEISNENTVLRFTCEVGYCLQGESDTIRCLNGAYDKQIPKCIPCSSSTALQTSITLIGAVIITILSRIYF